MSNNKLTLILSDLDFLLLNNAFALYVSGAAASPEEGLAKAAENIDSGRALAKLEEFAAASQQFKPE